MFSFTPLNDLPKKNPKCGWAEPHTALGKLFRQQASQLTGATHARTWLHLCLNITCFPCTRIVVMWGAIELANFLVIAAAWRTASLQFSQIKWQLFWSVYEDYTTGLYTRNCLKEPSLKYREKSSYSSHHIQFSNSIPSSFITHTKNVSKGKNRKSNQDKYNVIQRNVGTEGWTAAKRSMNRF